MRHDLHLDEPEEPDGLVFSGFSINLGEAMLAYRAYRDHGVLPFAGGSLEQPTWWWEIVNVMERMYYIRWWENLPEAKELGRA